MPCLRQEELSDLLRGALSAADVERVQHHLEHCDTCRRRQARVDDAQATIATAGALDTPIVGRARKRPQAVEIGEKLTRYRILEHLGEGGMGVVYAAFDPTLDRKVAIKLLHPGLTRSSAHRLQREAKALAKLNHPNVVTLYELGLVDGRMFLAMELVDGASLRDWLDTPRHWTEIVEVMRGAGAGLAAAHAAGLIHRDFKPDNVLIGSDGRPRVTDFGLVRAAEDASATGPESLERLPGSDELQTDHGVVVGTPAYMSTEQYQGRCDALSDQYSFCVTFYEALFGMRPYSGSDARSLQAAIVSGRPREPPSRSAPSWLVSSVMRGMSKEPSARFENMYALLDELDIRPRRRRQLRHGAAFVLLAGTIGVAAYASGSTASPSCEDPDALRGVWDDAIEARLSEHFVNAPRGLGARGWKVLEQQIDRHAEQWIDMQRSSCEAARQPGHAPGEPELVAMCLEDRRRELAALTEALASADPAVLDNPGAVTAALVPAQRCADTDSLARLAPRPTDAGATEIIEDESSALARARTLSAAGRFTEAITLAERANDQAAQLGWAPLLADTQATLASLLEQAGKSNEAVDAWHDAAAAAERARDDRRAAAAWIGIANLEGFELGRASAADQALRMAEAKIDRGELDAAIRADLEAARAGALVGRGEIEAALAAQLEASELLAASPNATTMQRAFGLSRTAAIQYQAGELDEAHRLNEEALRLAESELGEGHPQLATILGNLATSAYAKGDLQRARDALSEAIELFESSMVPDAPLIAKALSNLATIERALGNEPRGMELAERALALEEKVLGPDHLQIAQTLDKVGAGYADRGDYGAAVEAHERALAIRRKHLEEDHPWMAFSLLPLARAKMALGEHDEAIEAFERALALREKAGSEAGERGEAAFELARALVAAGGDRGRALELAGKARRLFADAGLAGVENVEAWIEEVAED